MSANQLWERYCQHFSQYPEVGMSLDISRIPFADDYLSSMEEKMQRAFAAMAELEAGEIANPDEGRMVGHYWLRNPDKAPNAELTNEINNCISRIKDFTSKVHSGALSPEKKPQFKNVLLVGIGGSALGPKLVYDALWAPEQPMALYFVDNTDPDGISKTLSQIGDALDETDHQRHFPSQILQLGPLLLTTRPPAVHGDAQDGHTTHEPRCDNRFETE